jgi:exosortase
MVFVWAYWPTLVGLVQSWNREPDYSHGYLVGPFAAYLLWARRGRLPGRADTVAWAGLVLIVLSVGVRVLGARYFLEALSPWSMLLWIAGAVWFFGGGRVCWWSLPAVAFLGFMIPLPFRVERWLSLPLQGIATRLSGWGLQCLGQPAITQGHTILVGASRLEVAQACSGLRVFVGITALACAYLIVVPRRWWERALLLVSVVPVALAANAVRIIATGLLYRYVSDEAAKSFSHDAAGWSMIVLAAAFFGLVVWYGKCLVREVEPISLGDVLRREHPPA